MCALVPTLYETLFGTRSSMWENFGEKFVWQHATPAQSVSKDGCYTIYTSVLGWLFYIDVAFICQLEGVLLCVIPSLDTGHASCSKIMICAMDLLQQYNMLWIWIDDQQRFYLDPTLDSNVSNNKLFTCISWPATGVNKLAASQYGYSCRCNNVVTSLAEAQQWTSCQAVPVQTV